jgi:hypothetical protein
MSVERLIGKVQNEHVRSNHWNRFAHTNDGETAMKKSKHHVQLLLLLQSVLLSVRD